MIKRGLGMDRTNDWVTRILLAARRSCLFAVLFLAAGCITSEKQIKHEIPRLYSVDDAQFAQTMGSMLGPSIVKGNRFKALLNGDEIFPAMLGAIEGAQQTVTFETYIYWSGEIGKKFAEALSERARAGVKVHVLLDWLGSSKIDLDSIAAMEERTRNEIQRARANRPVRRFTVTVRRALINLVSDSISDPPVFRQPCSPAGPGASRPASIRSEAV